MEKWFLHSSREKPKLLDIYLSFPDQGVMEAEKISKMLVWATVQTRRGLLPVFFLLSSVTKKTPDDKSALL
jgi:hypothetical protein